MDNLDWYESAQNWVLGDKALKGDAPRPYNCPLGSMVVDLDDDGNATRQAHTVVFDRKYWLAFEKALAVVQIPVRRYLVITLRERWVLRDVKNNRGEFETAHVQLTDNEVKARVIRETGENVTDAQADKAKATIILWMNKYAG